MIRTGDKSTIQEVAGIIFFRGERRIFDWMRPIWRPVKPNSLTLPNILMTFLVIQYAPFPSVPGGALNYNNNNNNNHHHHHHPNLFEQA